MTTRKGGGSFVIPSHVSGLYWRLVGEGEAPFWEGPDENTPIGMSFRYLAMAIVNKKHGIPVPFE